MALNTCRRRRGEGGWERKRVRNTCIYDIPLFIVQFTYASGTDCH